MTDFKPITTQEEFDERLKDRVSRAERLARDEFKGWTSPDDLQKLKDSHAKEIADLNSKHAEALKKYEGYDEKFTTQQNRIHELETSALKTKIAIGKKLPMDAIEFLQGDDEKSITESADRLSKLSKPTIVGFTKNTETTQGTGTDALFRGLAQSLVKND